MASRFKTRDQMRIIFNDDAVYLGEGIYSIWAPGGRVLAEDTLDLWNQWLARFDFYADERYDIETVQE